MLLMVENGIRVGICHAICRSAKANKGSWKVNGKNKDLLGTK